MQALRHRARVIFLGAPGSGKGTYARELSKFLGVSAISTGDMIREHVERKSSLGMEFEGYIKGGLLAPDELVTNMLLSKLESERLDGFILDGFPRTIRQAELLAEAGSIMDISAVIDISLKEEFIIKKLLGRRVCSRCKTSYNVASVYENGGEYDMPAMPAPEACEAYLTKRDDDTEDVIRSRMEIYKEETMPLVEFYGQRGLLKSFVVKKGLRDTPVLFDLVDAALVERDQGGK
jgi:adenylate kinase